MSLNIFNNINDFLYQIISQIFSTPIRFVWNHQFTIPLVDQNTPFFNASFTNLIKKGSKPLTQDILQDGQNRQYQVRYWSNIECNIELDFVQQRGTDEIRDGENMEMLQDPSLVLAQILNIFYYESSDIIYRNSNIGGLECGDIRNKSALISDRWVRIFSMPIKFDTVQGNHLLCDSVFRSNIEMIIDGVGTRSFSVDTPNA